MDWKSLFVGGAVVAVVWWLFDDEIRGLISKSAEAGVNTRGDILIGGNRIYQIPINSGGTDLPVVTPLASPVSGFGSYVGQTAYPMGGAENNLSELINGASWMNAATYTNASFGQNYMGRAVGNE